MNTILLISRYKWTGESPYSPEEQNKIKLGASIGWYENNVHKLKVVDPNEWLYRVGDKVQVLAGKDKGKTGIISKVNYFIFKTILNV